MSDRFAKARHPRKLRSGHRPTLERLERRAVLSVAGGPDLTYGTGGPGANGYSGLPTSPFISGSSNFLAKSSALDSNGDVVVVGQLDFMGIGFTAPFERTFYASRFTPAGQPDPNFDPKPLFNVSSLTVSYPIFGAPPQYSGATGVALQSDGKIVVVGEVQGVAKVIRLDANGTLDSTFGTGGIVTLGTVGSGDTMLDYASAVSILPGGQIAVAGSSSPTKGHDTPAVEILNADGTVDIGYGANGLAVVPLPAGAEAFAPIAPALATVGAETFLTSPGPVNLVQERGGALVIAVNAIVTGGSGVEVVATRLATAGAVDSTFGTAGQAIITPQSIFPTATSISGTALAIQSNGDVVVGGGVLIPGLVPRMAVVRLTSAGAVDAGFGVGGVNVLPLGATTGSNVGAIAVQADGKIVVADTGDTNYLRLNADGSLDNSFGSGGLVKIYQTPPTILNGPLDVPGGSPPPGIGVGNYVGSVGLAITSDGKILATAGNGGVYRLLARGAPGDYSGDGKTDRTVYVTSSGTFAFIPSNGLGGIPTIQFGIPGAGNTLPAPGAYGGEGVDEAGVYLPTQAKFAILNLQSGNVALVQFGLPGLGNSLPAPGDYDKSGATELAVYIPAASTYVYRRANGGNDVSVQIGAAGAIPVPADYLGTGQDDVAVYQPSTATFLIRAPASGQVISIPFGVPGGSIAVPGDYDGSGHIELAVYIPSLAEFIYRPAKGGPDVTLPFGIAGAGATLPAPGDYDGSGKTEAAGYFPGSATFVYRPAVGGPDVFAPQFGVTNNTIPFTLASATDLPPSFSPQAIEPPSMSASVEIPLTADVLDAIAGPLAKKRDAAR